MINEQLLTHNYLLGNETFYQMNKYLLIIAVISTSVYFIPLSYTHINIARTFALLSPCNFCLACQGKLSCNYTRWITGWGVPDQSFIDDKTLVIINTSTNCFNECLSRPRCYSYTYLKVSSSIFFMKCNYTTVILLVV